MRTTRIGVRAGTPRAHAELVVGALAPRLVSRGPRHARVAVAAAEMLLLSGDEVRIEVRVGEGCALEIEDVGGTVAYPGPAPSSWQVDIRIGRGGTLLWHGLPFVVAAGAEVSRRTRATLGREAALLLRETIVFGRHGEIGGRIVLDGIVDDDAGPVLRESVHADAARPRPGVLGGHRVMDTILGAGFRPPSRPGDLVLERPGAIARRLAAESHASGLEATWQEWARAMPAHAEAISWQPG